jgi:general stress protein YciG
MQDYKNVELKGGKAAAATNKARHGEDFYVKIGAIGGRKSRHGGFAKKAFCNCELIDVPHTKPQCAGKKGGAISRRKKK